MSPTPSTHRLQRGLPGYLSLFAPHAFASQRQEKSREPPSPLVFLPISAHSTAPPGIPFSPTSLKPARIESKLSVKHQDYTPDVTSRLQALYAQ